jgi:hypothetical protein
MDRYRGRHIEIEGERFREESKRTEQKRER